MRFPNLPVTSLEDATHDFEQLQTKGVDRINGTLVPLTGSAWVAPALINSWANFGGGFETAGYLKDPIGFVHLKGLIVSGATSTVAFVLPAGFRPGATTDHPANSGDGANAGRAMIAANGNVTITFAAGVGVGLSGITFLAEN
jgi:hypothetical protein